MKNTVDIIKKYSLDEVALLVIFAVGLLCAFFIVAGRSRIDMSDPIELPLSGLSISVPSGRGWEGSSAWVYRGANEYTLTAQLQLARELAAVVRCRYLLAPEKISPREIIQKEVAAARMAVSNDGQIDIDGITVEWAQLKLPRRTADIFLGVAQLPSGKVLAINVHAPNDHLLAGKLFKATAKSIVFESSELAQRGRDFIQGIKTSQMSTLLSKQSAANSESVYLIKDIAERPQGFRIKSVKNNNDSTDWSSQRIDSGYYIAGGKGGSSRSIYECDERLGRFMWRTVQTAMRSWSGAVELELSSDGRLRVSGVKETDQIYWPGESAICEICLDYAAAAFLDTYVQQAAIDVIFSRGQIIPAVIGKVDISRDDKNIWNASQAVRIDMLDEKGSSLTMYFDYEKKPLGKVEVGGRTLVWHVSDRAAVTDEFGNLERYLGRRRVPE